MGIIFKEYCSKISGLIVANKRFDKEIDTKDISNKEFDSFTSNFSDFQMKEKPQKQKNAILMLLSYHDRNFC